VPAQAGGAVDSRRFAEGFARVRANVETFIRGKADVVDLALTCLFSEGHLLIEDVPGVGKTSLAKAMALSIDGSLQRIQFTPDLLPSDVTGVPIFNAESRAFEFHEGPVFANVVVADEINRASPKTQAALLEVMEEYHVTVDAQSYPVPRPFIVVATQNPIELEGTYQLPEAQIDRFMMRISVGYPDRDTEMDVITDRLEGRTADDVEACLDVTEVQDMIDFALNVAIAAPVKRYIVDLASATRDQPELRLGVSPRGAIALALASRVRAASQGREYVTADDVKALAQPVLEHRMLVRAEAQLRGRSPDRVLRELLAEVPVPEQRVLA
jgi:MoxR-like ATPase